MTRRSEMVRAGACTLAVLVVAGAALTVSPALVKADSVTATAPTPVQLTWATPGEHAFTVPVGVTKIHVVAIGAAGGGGYAPGGTGARVEADIPTRPGRVLYAEVGSAGGPAAALPGADGLSPGGGGGANGGGAGDFGGSVLGFTRTGGGGGGGASDLRTCSATSSSCRTEFSRLLVAGGGGGAGASSNGGNAGIPDGAPGSITNDATSPGGGATPTTVGAGGCLCPTTGGAVTFAPGTFGAGGASDARAAGVALLQDLYFYAWGGGGGGGGFEGGGAGATSVVPAASTPLYSSGGGGGSSAGPIGTIYSLTSDPAQVTVTYTPRATLTAVTVGMSSPTVAPGMAEQLRAVASYSDGTARNVTAAATWTSSVPVIAAVSPAGVITGVSLGSSVISVVFQGVTGQATLTVDTMQTLTVSPRSVGLAVGATRGLAATAHFADGATVCVTSQVSWASSDTSIASVSASGVVTAIASGTASIVGAYDTVNGTAVVTAG